jgi:Holliday junction resolvase RusA-like endonuclease
MQMSVATTANDRRAGQSGQGGGEGAFSSPTTFTLPVPPSVNQLFRNDKKRGRVKTEAYDQWRATAKTALRIQQIAPIAGRVVVIFGVERRSLAADIDNRIKAMLDAIVAAKIIEDDKMVTAFAAAWLPAANGLAHVQIYPVQEIGIQFHPSKDGATGGWFDLAPQPDGVPDGPIDF